MTPRYRNLPVGTALTGGTSLAVGDIVRVGVTHPCTSFDRWPLIPLLDQEDRVTGTVTTLF